MIKRPFGIYLVALWSFFVMFEQVNHLIKMSQAQPPSERNPYIGGLLVIIFAFIIYVIVSLIQLKKLARVLTIIILSIGIVKIPLNMVLVTVNQISLPPRVVALLLFVVLINVLCVIYLCRPKFRVICRNFRKQAEEKRREKNMLWASRKGQ